MTASLEPAYLVLGNDHSRVREVIRRLKARFDDGAVETRTALTTPASAVVSEARMLGLFAQQRLVVVTGVEIWTADDVSEMVDYLADPSPDMVLMLVTDKLAANSRLRKAFAKPRIIECDGPSGEAAIARWVTTRFKEHGVAVDQRTALVLVRIAGEDSLDRLESDIARIVTYAGDEPVDAALIERLATRHVEQKVWELTDAWASRDRRRLLAITEQLLSQREHPARLVGVISRHLRYVHMARRLLERDSAGQVASALKDAGLNNAWAARKVVEQAQRISLPHADAALARVLQLEAELKGGSNLTGLISGGRSAEVVVFERGLLELV